MGYSSIQKKKCKCGCDRWPTLGFQGWHSDCHPDPTLKQRKIDQAQARQKTRTAATNAGNKLRREMPPMVNNEAGRKWDELQIWFKNVRKKLTGKCQCGCNSPSSKHDDRYFRHSCCHVFPKSKFESVRTHPSNFVERAFWGGCHTNMDDQSLDKWVNFADWENIKEIFHELAPLLTDQERATKFYSQFEKLVYAV